MAMELKKKRLHRHIIGGSVLIGKELWPEKIFQKGLVITTMASTIFPEPSLPYVTLYP